MKQNRPFSPGASRGYAGTRTLGLGWESWRGQMRASRTPAIGQTRPVFRASLGVSIHHCVLLLVCSQQAGPLSGCGLQVSSFQQGCGTRARAGGCSAAWELKVFLGSATSWSCLREAPSLGEEARTCASPSRRVSLAQDTGGESPCLRPPLSSHLHADFLPRVSPAPNTISSSAWSVWARSPLRLPAVV